MTRTHPSGPPAVGSWIPLIALVLGPNLAAGDKVQACLDVASAWGYLDAANDETRASVDHVTAMLFKLVRARS